MLKAGHNPAFNLFPFVSRLCNMQISMCLLCPLPTGSPMTQLLRHGVLDECYSGIPRTPAGCLVLGDGSPSIPRLYTLHLTPYTLQLTLYALHVYSHHQSCARRLTVSPVFPCQSVFIRGRYIFPAICCVLPVVWQYSRLFSFAPATIMLS